LRRFATCSVRDPLSSQQIGHRVLGLGRQSRFAAAAMMVAAVLFVSCSSHLTTSGADRPTTNVPTGGLAYPATVAIYGDSLSTQAEPYFKLLMRAEDASNTTYYSSYGGTAICDWLRTMRSKAARNHLQAVVLEFSGNAGTPCMAGIGYYTPVHYAKYRADTLAAIAIWVATGAHVFLVGAPVTLQQQESVPNWSAPNSQYAQIAAADPEQVTYIDAGATVEGPGGTYAQTFPCFIGEPAPGRWSMASHPTWSGPPTECTSAQWQSRTNRARVTLRVPSDLPMPSCTGWALQSDPK
jgi:hypothetical protein